MNIRLSYSDAFRNHIAHPRNSGDLPDANAIAEETNPVCGDRLRLSLRIRGGRIEAARFLAYGCPPTLACGSALAEVIEGMTVEEAEAWRTLPRAQKLSNRYRNEFRAVGWEFGQGVINVIRCPCCSCWRVCLSRSELNDANAASSRYWARSRRRRPATWRMALTWAAPPTLDTDVPALTAGRIPELKRSDSTKI